MLPDDGALHTTHTCHTHTHTHTQALMHAHLNGCANKCADFDTEVTHILVTWEDGLSKAKNIT